MGFRQDLQSTPGLERAFRLGLRALRSDAERVETQSTSRLRGSADLDTALSTVFPDQHRWDYVVAYASSTPVHLHWIEVHPASGRSAIGEVLTKLQWLKVWLKGDGYRLQTYKREFVWIASGGTRFRSNSPQRKRLANAGIHFAGGHYRIK